MIMSAEEKIEETKENIEEKVEDVKESVEEKTDDVKEEIAEEKKEAKKSVGKWTCAICCLIFCRSLLMLLLIPILVVLAIVAFIVWVLLIPLKCICVCCAPCFEAIQKFFIWLAKIPWRLTKWICHIGDDDEEAQELVGTEKSSYGSGDVEKGE